MVEQALKDYSTYKGLRSVMLRYFNAAGADFEGRIGEWHKPETHAIPLAIEAALGRRQGFKVFGTDYDTRDGTCVRDYIHILDLADAHVRAVDYLLAGGETVELNLGTGTGTTVKELLAAISTFPAAPSPLNIPGDATAIPRRSLPITTRRRRFSAGNRVIPCRTSSNPPGRGIPPAMPGIEQPANKHKDTGLLAGASCGTAY